MAKEVYMSIYDELRDLNLINNTSVVEFYPQTRDNKSIKVYRCSDSGLIYLGQERTGKDRKGQDRTGQDSYSYWSCSTRAEGLRKCKMDDERRYSQFRDIIVDKKWLDIGTGLGGLLDYLSSEALETHAVEPQKFPRNELIKLGYRVYESIADTPDDYFDVVTLFHVFEHFENPLDTLRDISKKMTPNGKVIIEVPHANDFLIRSLDLESFKKFTFWSEHLILHTRQSLFTYLNSCGFIDIHIQGYQRYPLANSLYWLSHGLPGGHFHWFHLRDEELDRAWSNKLKEMDNTDTLIAYGTKK